MDILITLMIILIIVYLISESVSIFLNIKKKKNFERDFSIPKPFLYFDEYEEDFEDKKKRLIRKENAKNLYKLRKYYKADARRVKKSWSMK